MDHLSRIGARPGVRVTLRARTPHGPTDVLGLVTGLTEDAVTLRRRDGSSTEVPRAAVAAARLVPLVARGRNPAHFDPDQVRRLAHDPGVGGAGAVWIGRLCDLVDTLDSPGVADGDPARCGGSAARVFGEWAVLRLDDAAHLVPLAAWAAGRDARNVAVTGPAAAGVNGLSPLGGE